MSEVQGIRELASEAESSRVHLVTAPDGTQKVIHRQGYAIADLPSAQEGRRRHAFDDVRSFAEWLNRHAKPDGAEVLVGPESIYAVLDPASPEPEQVTCELVKHPALEAWENVFGEPLKIGELHDLARAYSDYLSEPDLLLTALRGFSMMSGGEYTHQLDETGATRLVSTSERKDVQVKVPPELELNVPVFAGVKVVVTGPETDVEQNYKLRLFVSLNLDNAPLFTLTCPGLPLVMKEARDDAAAFLGQQLKDGFLIGLGHLNIDKRRRTEGAGD